MRTKIGLVHHIEKIFWIWISCQTDSQSAVNPLNTVRQLFSFIEFLSLFNWCHTHYHPSFCKQPLAQSYVITDKITNASFWGKLFPLNPNKRASSLSCIHFQQNFPYFSKYVKFYCREIFFYSSCTYFQLVYTKIWVLTFAIMIWSQNPWSLKRVAPVYSCNLV